MALLHRNTRTRPVPCCQPGHDVHCAAGGGAHQDRRCGWLLGTRRALNAWIVWPASVSRQAFTLRGEAARRLTRAGERGSGERGGFGGREPSPTVRVTVSHLEESSMLHRLARFSFRHRRLVAAVGALVFLVGIVVGGGVLSRLSSDVGNVAGSQSALAAPASIPSSPPAPAPPRSPPAP